MIKAFMYHDIRDPRNTDFKSRMGMKSFLTISQFKKQLNYLIKNYTIIPTRDLADIDKIKNEHCAILTFDDGLSDHYEVASILTDSGVKGTFLIPALPVRDRRVMKDHKIQFILSSLDEQIIIKKIFSYLNVPPPEEKRLWNKFSISKYKNNWWSNEMVFITSILRNYKGCRKITNELFKKFVSSSEKDFCEDFYLTENQVRNLVSCGMEIGGHGYLSENLMSLNQEKEISKSLEYVKKFYDGDLIFSYPSGAYNEDTLKLMEKYNCKFSYTTAQDLITQDTSLLEIPRFDGAQTLPT